MNFNLNRTQVWPGLSWNYLESTTVMLSVNTGWRYLNIIFGGHTSQQAKLLATISWPTRWEEFTIDEQTWDKCWCWEGKEVNIETRIVRSEKCLKADRVHPRVVHCHQKLLVVHFGLYPAFTVTSSAQCSHCIARLHLAALWAPLCSIHDQSSPAISLTPPKNYRCCQS